MVRLWGKYNFPLDTRPNPFGFDSSDPLRSSLRVARVVVKRHRARFVRKDANFLRTMRKCRRSLTWRPRRPVTDYPTSLHTHGRPHGVRRFAYLANLPAGRFCYVVRYISEKPEP